MTNPEILAAIKAAIPLGPYTWADEKNELAFRVAIGEMVSYHDDAVRLGEVLKSIDGATKEGIAVDMTEYVPAGATMGEFLSYQQSIAMLARAINECDPQKMGMMGMLIQSIGTTGVFGLCTMLNSDYLRGRIEGALCRDLVTRVGQKYFVHKYIMYKINLQGLSVEITGFAGLDQQDGVPGSDQPLPTAVQ